MSEHIQKKDIIKTLAGRMKTDEETAGLWLEAVLDTLLYFIKKGKCITLRNFGGFYVRKEKGSRIFKFNPCQKLRSIFGWSSTYKGK